MTTIRMGACPICQDPMMRCLPPFDYGWVNHALTSSRNCPLYGKTAAIEWGKRTGHLYPYDEDVAAAAPPLPESPWNWRILKNYNDLPPDGTEFVAKLRGYQSGKIRILVLVSNHDEDGPRIDGSPMSNAWEIIEWFPTSELLPAAPDSQKGGEG